MPPKPIHDSGSMKGKPLNIRITDQDDQLLDRLVDIEKADHIARSGEAPAITRADIVRWAIRDRARARGLLPAIRTASVQGVLPFVAVPAVPAPAPEPVERHEQPVEPVAVPAPAPEPVERHEQPVEPVAVPAPAPEPVERHEQPVEPVAVPARHRGKAADPVALRAELVRYLDDGGGTPTDVAAAIGVDRSTLSHFKNGRRGMAADKLQKLADYLRKRGGRHNA